MKKIWMFLVVFVVFSSSLYAGPGASFFKPGLYVGGGLSLVEEDFDLNQIREDLGGSKAKNINLSTIPKPEFNDGMALKLEGGFQLNRLLGLEAHLDYLEKVDRIQSNSTHISDLSMESFQLTIGVKVGLPMGRIRPYAFLGIGLLWADFKEVTKEIATNNQTLKISSNPIQFSIKFGLGIEYALTKNLSIYAESQYLMGVAELKGVRYVLATLGVLFRM